MKHLWRDYNLSIILLLLFSVSWVIQSFSGWVEFQSEQQTHGEAAELWGQSGYVWVWLRATFENWQSEFLQLFTFVVLTAYFIHKGSAESKDGDDEIRAMLHRIERRLNTMEKDHTVR